MYAAPTFAPAFDYGFGAPLAAAAPVVAEPYAVAPVMEYAPMAVAEYAPPAPVTVQDPVQEMVTFNPGPPSPYVRPVAPQYTENTQYTRYVHPFPRQRSRLPLRNRGFGLVDSWRADPTPDRLNPMTYVSA
eukprot:TRINITY_DN74585_c0_g1_i1.p1 TRINITY_DN74585_c0_g1~~TRINITY_DN74585_c0_g1_i1.p1  ORF type:complete len:131 (-),score=9.42 TRINITY_DN74585_c0_g1_i1:259-651(-)